MCSMPPAGYAGQRYAVSCLGFDADPTVRTVVGWTNRADGGALVKMIELHPCMHSPEVIDLFANQTVTPTGEAR